MLTKKILAASAIALTTAVGAVTITTGAGSASEVPDRSNVALLDRAAPMAPDAPGHTLLAPALAAASDADHIAPVRGVAVEQAGAALNIATDGTVVCAAPSIDGEQGGGACAPLPLPAEAIPFQIGDTVQGAWVAAVAPDGVVSVSAAGSNGETGKADVRDNVAIVRIGGAREVTNVSWTLADGRTFTQRIDLSDPSDPGGR